MCSVRLQSCLALTTRNIFFYNQLVLNTLIAHHYDRCGLKFIYAVNCSLRTMADINWKICCKRDKEAMSDCYGVQRYGCRYATGRSKEDQAWWNAKCEEGRSHHHHSARAASLRLSPARAAFLASALNTPDTTSTVTHTYSPTNSPDLTIKG